MIKYEKPGLFLINSDAMANGECNVGTSPNMPHCSTGSAPRLGCRTGNSAGGAFVCRAGNSASSSCRAGTSVV